MTLRPYTKVTLAYLGVGAVWILCSDSIVSMFWRDDPDSVTRAQTLKGWLYVSITGYLVYTLTRGAFLQQARLEAEKRAVFRKTIDGVHHILRNYLNQMQLVTVEASRCAEFDRSVLNEADEITLRATRELDKLGALSAGESISGDHIEGVVYQDMCPLNSDGLASPRGRSGKPPRRA